jgi:Na+(H+)/acetate symporter ActP
MRKVNFPIRDRLVLIPVELSAIWLPGLVAIGLGFLIGHLAYALAVLTVILCGTTFFPMLLPWLPSRDFSTKGAFLGFLAAIPFALSVLLGHSDWNWYRQAGQVLGYLLAMSSSIAYISLNFTGSTTFTSRAGVRKEIFTYIRPMVIVFAIGLVLWLVFAFVH